MCSQNWIAGSEEDQVPQLVGRNSSPLKRLRQVEQLAACRVIPNILVLRPCDAVEAVECWQIALESMKTPSILVITRQKLKQTRLTYSAKNLCGFGA